MRFYSETLGLSDSAFALLRDLIHERTGLFYENGKRDMLADKLSPLVIDQGFHSFLDYYYLLKYEDKSGQEWEKILDQLSVQETFFAREMDQVDALVNILVPQYAAAHPGAVLRIWSAACATGEEPITIAMALKEAGWLDRIPVELYASDASPRAIDRAKRGLYSRRSFRNLSPGLQDKYFRQAPNQQNTWLVDPELHSRIRWSVVNLMDETEVAPLAAAPMIFCRNVFIYFSERAIHKTISLFFKRMPSPGYLFVGVSESLFRLASYFELQEIGGAFVYVKQ